MGSCHYFETIKEEYADWESFMSVPEIQRKLNTPLFDGNTSFQDKIFDIVTYYNFDSTNVSGEFKYKNDFLYNLPIQINSFTKDSKVYDKYKNRINKKGFDDKNIEYYFFEIQKHNKKELFYFIDTKENIVYFYTL
jgi:hypothetical protein